MPDLHRFSQHTLALAVRAALLVGPVLGLALAPQSAVAQVARPAQVFDIPAGPLSTTLTRIASQAGWQLSVNAALLAGKSAPAIAGRMSAQSAIEQALAGSGLDGVVVGGELRVRPRSDAEATLSPLTVTAAMQPGELPKAYAGGQLARGGRLGMLGNVDTMDSPFSVTAFTAQSIQDAQATTVADMVRLDPSVRSSGMGADNADAFFIRGFAVGDNNTGEIAFDGLYGVGPNYRVMADYAERIEILKGPAAMIYGMSPNGAGGGTINVVPKRAANDLTQVRGDYLSDGQLGGHVDVARRFGPERQFGVRFNGAYQNGDTALDNQSKRTSLGALALDYQGEQLKATLDLIDQREKIDAPSRRLWLNNGVAVPEAPDGRRNTTQSWEYSRSDEQSALLRLEYEATEQLSVFGSFGTAQTDVERLFNTPSITSSSGNTSVLPVAAIFDVQRSSLEGGLRGRFETGALKHRVTLQFSRYEDSLGRGTVNGRTYTSNLYNPIDRPAQDVALPGSVLKQSANTLSGVALSDTVSAFDEQLQVILGLRQQNVNSENYAASGAVSSSYDKSAVTPMLGVVFKPLNHVSLYGNYIEGLAKGDSAPMTALNAGEVFAPYKTKQHEVGVKVDHGRLMTTLSAFQITRPSGQLSNNVYAVDGEQRNRGIELSAFGAVGDGVRLYSGITWIDAKLTQTNSAATQGNTAVGVPGVQASFNAEWDVPLLTGLTVSGSVLHSGKQYVDQSNSRQLPAWTTLDLGARYRTSLLGKSVVWRANLRNALDKEYWAGVSTWSTLAIGMPRTFQLSATVDF